jgi:hypothetical protein
MHRDRWKTESLFVPISLEIPILEEKTQDLKDETLLTLLEHLSQTKNLRACSFESTSGIAIRNVWQTRNPCENMTWAYQNQNVRHSIK